MLPECMCHMTSDSNNDTISKNHQMKRTAQTDLWEHTTTLRGSLYCQAGLLQHIAALLLALVQGPLHLGRVQGVSMWQAGQG